MTITVSGVGINSESSIASISEMSRQELIIFNYHCIFFAIPMGKVEATRVTRANLNPFEEDMTTNTNFNRGFCET